VKIAILHQHFKTPQSGGAIRSYYLAKALVDQGHDVTVVTGGTQGYRLEVIEGINVYHLPIAYENRFGFLQRVFSFAKYISGIIRRPLIIKGNDLVYAISVPLTIGLAALWIKRKHHIPFIFEVGDLWPDAPIQMGFVKSAGLKKFLFRLERKIYREARSIVALSPAIKSSIEKRVQHKTIHLIPNMADTCFYKPTIKSEEQLKKFNIKEKFVVSYTGTIGLANGLEFFLQCAKACKDANLSIRFLICGEGATLPRLKKEFAQMKLDNLTFIPFQQRDGVKEVMGVSDSIFVCYKPLPVLETGSPNKYFDGLAAGKLIIINFGGWIRQEIESKKCGIYIDPHTALEFPDLIRPFLENESLLENYQHAARALAEKSYSRKILSEKFVTAVTTDT
jgi:glycosyltransferase involved in cell wall biosynthesis